jgi:phosphoribosylformimino-5-aminoimidazole carboxamide ribotide isomerase
VEVIPVVDVLGGRAVRADGGRRSGYRPVESVLAATVDPVALARSFRRRLTLDRLYVADLDAIVSRGAELDCVATLVRTCSREGSRVWVDAGASEPAAVGALLDAGARRVIIGLETLPALDLLQPLVARFGTERLAFSLDLRARRPVSRVGAVRRLDAGAIVRAVLEAGFSTLIVLDLARVGSRRGLPLASMIQLRRAAPRARWIAGGGTRGLGDLLALARAGYDGCLVATALHDGSVGCEEILTLKAWAGGRHPPAVAG